MKTTKFELIAFLVFIAILLAMIRAASGAAIPGTIIAAKITTGDTANTFSIGDTAEMNGTMKQVPDVATRDLITADRRQEGMFCYVTGETNLYALVGGTNNANWVLWASPTNAGLTLVDVRNFVETNIFQTIHVLTNFFDTVYVTNEVSLLYLNPNQFVVTDAADKLVSSLNGVTLTNISPTNVDLMAGSGITFTTNLHQVTVSAPASGFATNVVWPTAGTNVILTTNGFAVKIDVPSQTNMDLTLITNISKSTAVWPTEGTNVVLTTNGNAVRIDVPSQTNMDLTTITNIAKAVGQTNLARVVAGTNAFVTPSTNSGVTTFTVDGPAIRSQWSVGDITNAGTAAYSNANVFVLKAGDTSTGPQLTTSASTNAPAANEFVTGQWVRGLLNNGFFLYASTNIQVGATNADSDNQFVYQFHQSHIPDSAVRVWATAFLTNNGYVGSQITTNTFLSLAGGAVVNTYMSIDSGGGKALSIKPEIYLSYDRTNWFGDFDASAQALTPGVTNLYAFVVSFPAQVATNSTGFYVERRLKVTSVGGAPTLQVFIGTNAISGTNNASHTVLNAASVNGAEAVVVPGTAIAVVTNGLAYTVSATTPTVNNVWTSGSSNFNNNAVWTWATNANNTTPDFAVSTSTLSTNNAFTWLAPTHIDTSGKAEQWMKTSVTNTTAVAKLMTAPSNVHVCGAGSMYVTNWTEILWQYVPPSGPTNMWPIPGF